MIKKHYFIAEQSSTPISPIFLEPNNLENMKRHLPVLLSDENLAMARNRFGTKEENLVVILPSLRVSWWFDGKYYVLTQDEAVLMDGASSPINIGDIGPFVPNLLRAWYVHDALYALFHQVDRRTCDRIFTCFAEADGTNLVSRMIMYTCLRAFGKHARTIKPEDHWNFGRMKLEIK
jgi:hypothetical protein